MRWGGGGGAEDGQSLEAKGQSLRGGGSSPHFTGPGVGGRPGPGLGGAGGLLGARAAAGCRVAGVSRSSPPHPGRQSSTKYANGIITVICFADTSV